MENSSKVLLLLFIMEFYIVDGSSDVCSLGAYERGYVKLSTQKFDRYSCPNNMVTSPFMVERSEVTEFQCHEICFRIKDCEFLYYSKDERYCLLFRERVDRCFSGSENANVYYIQFARENFTRKVSSS